MARTYGLSHIALAVSDLDRSLGFYQALLGARILYRDDHKIEIGTPHAHDVISLEFASADSLGHSGSVAHFGFRLTGPEEIDAAREAVSAGGGLVVESGEFGPGQPYLYARDPDGYLIELWYEPEPAARDG
jgi:catechol 2,3-dioxygenase-like lactoylglutathione lyase family enzyme